VARIVHLCSIVFGYALIALSFVVVVETLGRKLIGFSLQGADELGGYVLAIGSSIAFSVALIERGHIRIDISRRWLSRRVAAAADWVAAVLMFCFAALLAWVCLQVLRETIDYGSVAPSPWATPLVYPQALWFVAMALFFFVALWLAFDATKLFVSGRLAELRRRHGPKELEEEIAEELDDLSRR
jgi:TRAP-type C4-dicarboxylate transport system permease small subunit